MQEARTTIRNMPRQPQQRTPYDDVLLNRYRIMNDCGTGGFGTVLACWDTRLQRRVAIKRLPLVGTGDSASSALSDALAEARTSSRLSHPNIVTVYDFEVEGSYAYLVMEYVDGLTLTELLRSVEGGVLTHDETACIIQSVSSALGFAHENGVLHMDIKPTNIMIDRSGIVKLCDFGMANLASAAGYAGARGGTVGYMPPEQIQGAVVDERTDVFSLAVVVWQALFGASPFAAPSAEASLKLIEKGVDAPSKLDPALAGTAESVLLRALAPNPSARIPSVETFAKELVYVLGDPQAGANSLCGLVSQAPEDAGDDPEDWEGERLPLAISYPWLPGLFVRAFAALVTALCAWPIAGTLFATRAGVPLIATIACAGAAALWPPLGSAAAMLGACCCVATQATTAAPILLAAICAIAFTAWWALCGTVSPMTTPTMLLPACLASPLAGVSLAGYALTPAPAFVTACVSWFVGRLWPAIIATNFNLDNLVDTTLAPLMTTASLVSLAGCGIAAALCAAITWRGESVSHAVAGQVVGCMTLVGFQLVAARMENGGIWADPSWDNTGIAVVLGVLVCMACVLHGPRITAWESEV